MTADEIKQSKSMCEVVEEYGIRINRNGYCVCPFHNEKTASMKIYRDSFYCYGCGESGDIFSFVQKVSGVDFKTAFMELGGEYPKNKKISMLKAWRAEKRKEKDTADRAARIRDKKYFQDAMHVYGAALRKMTDLDVFSDQWCRYMKQFELFDCKLREIEEEANHK